MKETKRNVLNDIKKFFFVAVIFLLIAVLGSSVKAPGWAIPAGTIAMAAFTWFGSVGSPKKTRIQLTIVWTALVLIFTTIAVLVS